MELFSVEQSDFMTNNISRDIAVKAAFRDGYDTIAHHYGYILVLLIDEDREERLKKNYYCAISPTGFYYSVPGYTYKAMSRPDFLAFVNQIEDGKHEGVLWI